MKSCKSLEAASALYSLKDFMPYAQKLAMRDGVKGEEGEFFAAKLIEMAAIVAAMPKTYEQDGKGEQAVAFLHYFKGSCDWYITERDMEKEQHQAFGLANLGYGGELGYISIVELVANGVELDLHFSPKSLAAIKEKEAA